MSTQEQPSTVYLVGAGPGDPDLITVKGMDLVERCDVLVYDSLVSAELVLRSAATDKHYVGKTAGGHALRQEEITALLVRLASEPGERVIVRLKGGDPYVFGRGGEEALACVRAGVPVEVVPGVPAGVAVPAYAGVPITHRDFCRGAIFVTGHRARDRQLDLPWEHLVGSGLTLVFYMSVATLPTITEQLLAHRMDAHTPALVVQEGTLPGQRKVSGRLDEIAGLARDAGIRPPALVVVGEVAGLGEQLFHQEPRPLAGKTVVLVRAEEHHYPEIRRMRTAGARVVDVPGVRCRARPHDPGVAEMLESVQVDDVVVFTSAMAARFWAALWRERWPADAPRPTLAAASHSIARALEQIGHEATITPAVAGAGRTLDALREHGVAPGTTLWLPRSTSAGPSFPWSLEEAGFAVRVVDLYETLPVPLSQDVRSMLTHDRVDAILFLSGTCVESVVEAVPEVAARSDRRMLVAAIGPKACAVARSVGVSCQVVADPPSVGVLVDRVMDALTGAPGEPARRG